MKSLAQQPRRAARSLPPNQLRHLILKLRWMGMEEEAEKVTAELVRVNANTEIVIAVSETD
jgi:hypothetical protein